jgi:hypothetical protein
MALSIGPHRRGKPGKDNSDLTQWLAIKDIIYIFGIPQMFIDIVGI